MPKKPNKSGQPQEYIPSGNGDASGEYADDNGNNVHITFEKFDKPKEPLGVEVKNEGEQPSKTDTIKAKYNGKGKNVLNNAITNKLPNSANTKKLLNDIENADDELSGVIGDFYNANPNIKLKIGKNLRSKYQTTTWILTGKKEHSVLIGQGMFTDEDSYSKGGVFFHESGHALDDTYIVNGRKDNYSENYKSKKYGMTLSDKIKEEMTKNLSPELFKQLKGEVEKETQEIKSKLFTPEMEKEYEHIKNLRTQADKDFANDETYLNMMKKQEEIRNELDKAVKESDDYWYSHHFTRDENLVAKVTELKNKWTDFRYNELISYQNQFHKKYVTDEMEKKFNELSDLKFDLSYKAKHIINVKYGDLSDMCQASLGTKLTGMGHEVGYFYNGKDRGTEAFAEIMSAKATNPDSLKVLQKYIPQTLEIFDEIINEIKGVK